MKNYYKFQKIISVIPFFSTFVIAFITMITLKRQRASKKIWIFFAMTFFLSGAVVWFVNTFVMTGKHPVLNIIVSGLIFTIANMLFVDYQVMATNTDLPKSKVNVKLYVFICLAAIIANVAILFVLFPSPDSIDDINGSQNTNLAVLSLDQIISNDNYTEYSSHTSYKGLATDVSGRLKDYDYQNCSFNCEMISGVKTIQVTKTTENQITLNVSSQVEKGNMEIVIIVDGMYYDHIPINQEISVVLTDVANKMVVVKIGAESAKMKISVNRQIA